MIAEPDHTLDDLNAAHFGLNGRQYQFCLEYIVDLNATQAYIRAGYSKNGARQSAYRLLTNADIENCIHTLKQMQHDRLQRLPNATELAKHADAVLMRMGQMAGLNIGKFIRINENGLPFYDFTNVTEEDLLGLSGIDIKQEIAADVSVISISIKADITKNLHALARHHSLLKETVTFEEPTEIDDVEIAKRIAFLLDKVRRKRHGL